MISLQEWEDVNLAWNTSEYGNVEDVRIPPSALWKPDILMYNRYAINATWSLSDTQYLACLKMSLNLGNLPDSYVLWLLVWNVVLSFRCAFWSQDGFPSPGRQGTLVQVFPRTLWILWRGFSALWTRQKTFSSPNQSERIFWGCVHKYKHKYTCEWISKNWSGALSQRLQRSRPAKDHNFALGRVCISRI